MKISKPKIKKILVITLSNIGDVILTFPVIDILKRDFPKANLSVVVGPKAENLLSRNPYIDQIIVFQKKQPFLRMISWIFLLRRKNYDLVVDLRNTMIPFLVSTKYLTSPFLKRQPHRHMRQQHLLRLKSLYSYKTVSQERFALHIQTNTRLATTNMICNEIGDRKKYIVVAPGAADSNKRWSEENFAKLADELIRKHEVQIAFVGDKNDRPVADAICHLMSHRAVNFCGRIDLIQLAVLLERSCLAIVNDSAPMHLASYLNVPTLALFGPTDPLKYGPWSEQSCVIERKKSCPACQGKPGVKRHTCLSQIKVEDALNAFELTPDGVLFRNSQP